MTELYLTLLDNVNRQIILNEILFALLFDSTNISIQRKLLLHHLLNFLQLETTFNLLSSLFIVTTLAVESSIVTEHAA